MAHSNRLANEASPYLLQHATNPVDWYPWGPEALERARREDKPILLSIGYAACHWCHVMERESFEDEAIAKQMNELYINVKVDREERPDLDHVYQLVVQLMGRGGGWPLTVFLTPDQRPFFAGTYFPPRERYGMPSFSRVLDAVAEAYRDKRGEVESQAAEITQAIGRVHGSQVSASDAITKDALAKAAKKLVARFDDRNGGFGDRPKFPNTMALDVLLRRGALEGDAISRACVELALDKMAAGGVWDHLRGGFHRYSTDAGWLVPHFEKMLYDNALLLRLYVEGFRVFKKPLYATIARELVGYLFAEMRDESGAFYASQDADSEGEEGRFFVFTPSDVRRALDDDARAVDVALAHFGVTDKGNFEHTKATVLSANKPLDDVASDLGISLADVEANLSRAKAGLLAYREQRPRPMRDDKLLACWNGLLIGSLADAGRALGEPTWVAAAERALHAIERALVRDGRVGRYVMPGAISTKTRGFLDDHAYLASAALDLFEATHDARYVAMARSIADVMLERFWDKGEGGFFLSPSDGEALITRAKDAHDQAIPSAAAVAAMTLLRLATLADESYRAPAERVIGAIASMAIDNPFGLGQSVLAVDTLARGPIEIVIVGDLSDPRARALSDAAFAAYLPHRLIVAVDPRALPADLSSELLAPAATRSPNDPPAAFVCRERACSAPVTTASALTELLR
jgi:hypothetical protein